MVKVVAEDEGVARDCGLGLEGKGYRVAVVLVGRVGEVGGCAGCGGGETCVSCC